MKPRKCTASRLALLAAAVVGIASFAYQAIAEARDRRRFPPPGRLVDIGGRRLHLVTAGEGTPAVVIIHAVGGNVLEWVRIQREAASQTLVCAYDRAGFGFSGEPSRRRRTPERMAADLHALLQAARIPPPYILACHSVGGVVGRRFFADHPREVAGMLLIDSSHEDQARRLRAFDWREGAVSSLSRAARYQARISGVRRLAVTLGMDQGLEAMIARVAPAEFAGAARMISLSSRQKRGDVQELLVLAQSWGQPPGLGSLPLTVLTASPRPWRGWPVWVEMQEELAKLSANSLHVNAEMAGHYVHLDDPDLVIQAIRDLVRRCC